jgi:hypothetical protein
VYPRISANSTVAWVNSAAIPGACTAPFNVTIARSLGTLSGRFEGAITGGLRSDKGMPCKCSVGPASNFPLSRIQLLFHLPRSLLQIESLAYAACRFLIGSSGSCAWLFLSASHRVIPECGTEQ